jgi:5-dehydro-2-deoxygluconokinase
VLAAPIKESRVLLITGTGLSRAPSRDATLFAAEQARKHGTTVVLDLDLRAELWPDARTFGVAIRSILPLVNVVIGTYEEVTLAVVTDWTKGAGDVAQASVARTNGDDLAKGMGRC